jgi:predicted nucleic acid-binding protein
VARAWLDYLWESSTGRVSAQVLSEYYTSVTRKLGLDRAVAQEDVRKLIAWDPLPIDAHLIQAAWSVEHRYGLSWWDSLIVAAAEHLGCDRILTEDLHHEQQYGPVLVVSPFEAPPAIDS